MPPELSLLFSNDTSALASSSHKPLGIVPLNALSPILIICKFGEFEPNVAGNSPVNKLCSMINARSFGTSHSSGNSPESLFLDRSKCVKFFAKFPFTNDAGKAPSNSFPLATNTITFEFSGSSNSGNAPVKSLSCTIKTCNFSNMHFFIVPVILFP